MEGIVYAIIDTRIKTVVTFHDVLNVLRAKRGMGTAIMELNMAQDLVIIYHNPLLMALLGLQKAYDNLDRGRILQTLEGYGAGPKMWGLLEEFRKNQEVVTSQNVYHGPQFRATCGTTQGGIVPPKILNVAVDSVV